MKRKYNLLGFLAIAIAFAFSACNPLSDTYKTLGPTPLKAVPTQSLTYTLTPSDYAILPSTVYASTQLSFVNAGDANQYVPTILNSKYGTYPDGSVANITFSIGKAPVAPPTIKLADSVYNATPFGTQPTGLQYTLTNPADYLLYSKNIDLSVTQVLAWLKLKYSAPVANQLEVLTWIYYPTLSPSAPQIYPGVSLSTTTVNSKDTTRATGSFLYLNGAWIQAYHLTAAQYAAVGRGQYNQFTSSDDASLVSYFNGILKADASITANATVGSIQYVSFNYYLTASKITSQRVIALTFDGTNWGRSTVSSSTPATATFTKSAGKWIGDPTVYYSVGGAAAVGGADLTLLSTSGIGGSVLAGDLASTVKYGDFSTYWISLAPVATPNAFLNQAFILILTKNFPTPKVNIPYKVTFPYYINSKDVATTYTYTYNGTAWVAGQ